MAQARLALCFSLAYQQWLISVTFLDKDGEPQGNEGDVSHLPSSPPFTTDCFDVISAMGDKIIELRGQIAELKADHVPEAILAIEQRASDFEAKVGRLRSELGEFDECTKSFWKR
ncbi:hypothetical protein BHE74_00025000 [Ensete ventricosum]|nr:hypothetical protein BHE74_00025000 [Ensete ventricosum]